MNSPAAMVIDPATGAIGFEGMGDVLKGGMDRVLALDALEGLEASFGGQPVHLLPYFSYGELTEVHFSVALPNAPMEEGWPTKAAIDAEIAFVRKELERQLGQSLSGGQAKFAWGGVWSLFDSKGFQAVAGVRWGA